MSNDGQQQSDAGRRKFDDVTSLFGTIVPPAGTPVRPPFSPKPEIPRAEPEPPLVAKPVRTKAARPPELRRVDPPKARPPSPPPPQPTRRTKAAKSGKPFADAFAPRPNWHRQRTSRSWSWLLLVPIAAAVAVGIATLDPKAIRDIVDRVILKIQPPTATDVPSLLPGPFRPGATTAPSAPPSAASQARPIPTPAEAPPPEAAAPKPPIEEAPPTAPAPEATAPETTRSEVTAPEMTAPTDPAPPPPVTDPAPVIMPAPIAPAPTVPTPVVIPDAPILSRVTVTYRRGNAASEAEARRLAAKIGQGGTAVDLRPSSATVRAPAVVYHSAADKEAATALAQSLAENGAGWTVRQGTIRSVGGAEIVVP